MRILRIGAALGLFRVCTVLFAQMHYFPDGTFDNQKNLDRFVAHCYGSQLAGLKEPSLLDASRDKKAETYHFTWLRTFHHPVAIGVEVRPDGTGLLTTKMCDGAAGYKPGMLTMDTRREMSTEEVNRFRATFEGTEFWKLPSYEREMGGTDGAEWVFGAVRQGQYKLVSLWSPKSGALRELGLSMVGTLGKLDIPKEDVY